MYCLPIHHRRGSLSGSPYRDPTRQRLSLDKDPLGRNPHGWRPSLPEGVPLEGTWDQAQRPPGRTMGPGSQMGSDIIQTPPHPTPNRMTHASKNVTLSQTSFAAGKNRSFEESCPLLEIIHPQSPKHSRGLKQRLSFFKATTLLIQP